MALQDNAVEAGCETEVDAVDDTDADGAAGSDDKEKGAILSCLGIAFSLLILVMAPESSSLTAAAAANGNSCAFASDRVSGSGRPHSAHAIHCSHALRTDAITECTARIDSYMRPKQWSGTSDALNKTDFFALQENEKTNIVLHSRPATVGFAILVAMVNFISQASLGTCACGEIHVELCAQRGRRSAQPSRFGFGGHRGGLGSDRLKNRNEKDRGDKNKNMYFRNYIFRCCCCDIKRALS